MLLPNGLCILDQSTNDQLTNFNAIIAALHLLDDELSEFLLSDKPKDDTLIIRHLMVQHRLFIVMVSVEDGHMMNSEDIEQMKASTEPSNSNIIFIGRSNKEEYWRLDGTGRVKPTAILHGLLRDHEVTHLEDIVSEYQRMVQYELRADLVKCVPVTREFKVAQAISTEIKAIQQELNNAKKLIDFEGEDPNEDLVDPITLFDLSYRCSVYQRTLAQISKDLTALAQSSAQNAIASNAASVVYFEDMHKVPLSLNTPGAQYLKELILDYFAVRHYTAPAVREPLRLAVLADVDALCSIQLALDYLRVPEHNMLQNLYIPLVGSLTSLHCTHTEEAIVQLEDLYRRKSNALHRVNSELSGVTVDSLTINSVPIEYQLRILLGPEYRLAYHNRLKVTALKVARHYVEWDQRRRGLISTVLLPAQDLLYGLKTIQRAEKEKVSAVEELRYEVAFESTRESSVVRYERKTKRRVPITVVEVVSWLLSHPYQFQSTSLLELKLLKQLYLIIKAQYDRESMSERKVELLKKIRNLFTRLRERGEDISQCYLYQYESPITEEDMQSLQNKVFIAELAARTHRTIETSEDLIAAGLALDPYIQIKQGVSNIAQLVCAVAFSVIALRFLKDPLSMPWLGYFSSVLTSGNAGMTVDVAAKNITLTAEAKFSDLDFYQFQAIKTTGTITLLFIFALAWMSKELADNMLSLLFAIVAPVINLFLNCAGIRCIPLAPAGFNELVHPLRSWENFCGQIARFVETFAKLGPVWIGMALFIVLVHRDFGHVDLTNDLPTEPAETFSRGLTIESSSVAFLYGTVAYCIAAVVGRNSWDYVSTKFTHAGQLCSSVLRVSGLWRSKEIAVHEPNEASPLLAHVNHSVASIEETSSLLHGIS